MIVKEGEVICIASGIYESYSRQGPFVATQDFDLDSFVEEALRPLTERWQVSSMLGEIPRKLFESGFIATLPCRKIYLGAMGEVDIREEEEDF